MLRECLFILLICFGSFAQVDLNWVSFSTLHRVAPSGILDIQAVNPTRDLCPFDAVLVQWNLSSWSDRPIFLGTRSSTSDVVILNKIEGHQKLSQDSYGGIIKTPIDEDTEPVIEVIALNQDTRRLLIRFRDETNTPQLLSSGVLKQALAVIPDIFGTAIGEWTHPKELSILCEDAYITHVIQQYHTGNAIAAKVRNTAEPSHSNGSLELRLPEADTFQFFLVEGDNDIYSVISDTVNVSVSVCNVPLLPPMKLLPESFTVLPFIRFKGLLAISGRNGIILSSQSLPSSYRKSWTISMWMFLAEGPTNSYRTLFFKGDSVKVTYIYIVCIYIHIYTVSIYIYI